MNSTAGPAATFFPCVVPPNKKSQARRADDGKHATRALPGVARTGFVSPWLCELFVHTARGNVSDAVFRPQRFRVLELGQALPWRSRLVQP